MLKQSTIKKSVKTVGVGLHSGTKVELTLRPAEINTGIVFRRVDLTPPVEFSVSAQSVGDTRMASTLLRDGVKISTVEHVMSACAGLGIDNLVIDVSAEEIPIMDGSSAAFIYLLESAGIVEQTVPKRFIRIKHTIEVIDGDKWVRLDPFEGFKVTLAIEFNHPAFNRAPQTVEIDFSSHSYIDEISRARTFGFMHEVESMRSHGLGLGGNLENAVVIDDEYVLNPGGLRFPDEFVRHKILDAIGDLYIVGHPLIAAFSGFKSGHALNNALLRKLLETPSAWEFVSFSEVADAPSSFHRLPVTA